MSNLTYGYAAVLILLGLIGYFATGRQSVTALIPAFFGVLVLVLSMVVGRLSGPGVLRWTLIILAVVGFGATVGGIPKVIQLIGGSEIARPPAAISQAVMAVVSLIVAVMAFLQKPGSMGN